ncbi:hypothetical protein ACTWJ9_00745 [Streptomyces sp. GDS52]|uniref:Secreted protein n=1 Tax=Streptomyces cathayae TaxID=3031124 RepID=A0ABY8JYL2_9ACTN|nr:hypothetical protein [Streptomyces sp. HUAS 5]WGD39112.1 hypothetical protein PYS65_02460 [Streptomyces sp. HUAS 5]
MEILVLVVLLALATAGRADDVPHLTTAALVGADTSHRVPTPAAQVSADADSGTVRTGLSRIPRDFAIAWRAFLRPSPP